MGKNTEMFQEIQRSLGKLEGTVKEGFKGIHHRQDVTNGNIRKHQKRLDEIEGRIVPAKEIKEIRNRVDKVEKYIDTQKGKIGVIAGIVGFGGGILSPFLLDFIRRLFS